MKNYHSKRSAHYSRLKAALAKLDRAGYQNFELVEFVEIELPFAERDKRNIFVVDGLDTCDELYGIAMTANTEPRYGGDRVNNFFCCDLERGVEEFFSLLRHTDGSTTVAVFADYSNVRKYGDDDE